MSVSYNSDLEIITVQVPATPSVIQVQLPGVPGPAGPQGIPGQANVLTIGTVTTGAAGGSASATISGVSPNQTLNLTIPRGNTGLTGPTNALAIGTVNTLAAGASATATITGTAPSQILNLGLPAGATGPINTLTIGTVTTGTPGASAVATLTGTAPNQTLNLTIPAGATGASNTLTIGTVTTGAPGSSAVATITGTAPNQTLNLTIPTGAQGPIGAGAPDATSTAKGSIQLAGDLSGTAAAPTVPALANKANSSVTISAGTGLTGGGDLTAARTLAVSYGTAAGTAAQGNDTRIVNAVQTTDLRVTADQAVATASIRTIGTGALQAAAGNHTHIAIGISDSTTVGRSVLTAVDAPTARTAIGAGTSSLVIGTIAGTAADGAHTHTGLTADAVAGTASIRTLGTGSQQAAAGNHTHTASGISDSTTVGRSVLTAVDAPTARTAIGAGTSSLVIGTSAGTAKDGAYQPASTNISDSTAIGRSVLTAATTAAGRSAIAASADLPFTATKVAAYTASANEIAVMNVSGGATTLTLPSAPAGGTKVGFYAIGATTATPLTVTRGGTDTIGISAATSVTEPLNDVVRTFRYDAPNTRWVPIADVKPLGSLDGRYAALSHTHTSAQISDAVAAATANTVVKRDTNGGTIFSSVQVNNAPSFAFEATRKDYVDTQVSTRIANTNGITAVVQITQAAYTALATKDANTLYVIVG